MKLDPGVSSQSLSFLISRNQEPVPPSFLEAHSALGLSGHTVRGLPRLSYLFISSSQSWILWWFYFLFLEYYASLGMEVCLFHSR